MAQLKDTVVYGNLRVTDSTLTDILQVTTVKAPTTAGGTTYGVGSNKQVLTSNGTSSYWGAANDHTHSQYYDSTISRTKNTVLAAPNGSNGAATFRALVAADIPALNYSKVTSSSNNGYIKVDNTDMLVYSHPSYTANPFYDSRPETTANYAKYVNWDELGSITEYHHSMHKYYRYQGSGEWIKLAYIHFTQPYCDQPIEMRIIQRAVGPYKIVLRLNSENDATADIAAFYVVIDSDSGNTISPEVCAVSAIDYTGGAHRRIDLYVKSFAGETDLIEVSEFNIGDYSKNADKIYYYWNGVTYDTKPSDAVDAVVKKYVTQADGVITTKLTVGTGSGNGQQSNGLKIWTKAGANRVLGLYWSYGDTWGTNPAQVSYSNQYDGATPGDKGALLLLPYQAQGTVDDGSKGMWIVKDHAYIDGVELSKVTHNHDGTYLPLTGGTLTGRVTTEKALNYLVTGTGTAGADKGSGANPRYVPAKWVFDTGQTPTDGDLIIIKSPTAGHDYGIYMSIDNGTTYHPIVLKDTSRLTTHYGGAGNYMAFVFRASGSAASMIPFAGNTDGTRVTVTGGVWTGLDYYDSGNTYDRTSQQTRIYAGGVGVFRYSICGLNSAQRMESFTTTGDANGSPTTTKTFNTSAKFAYPPVLMYNSANAVYSSGTAIGNNVLYEQFPSLDMRYSCNKTSTAGFTQYKPVFIECTFDSNGFWSITSNGFVQTFTSGKYYILVGCMYSTSVYQLALFAQHPVYYYDGTNLTMVPFTKDEKTKLAGVATGATKVESSSTNGKIKINGTDTTVYTHPTYTSKTSGLYKITVDGTGHVSGTASVGKSDIPTLDYVPLTGSTGMSGLFQANGNSSAFAVVNTDSTLRLGLHIGSGGENRGLYDWGDSTYTAGVGDWVFRVDAQNRVGIRATLLESETANNGMAIPVLGGTPGTETKNIYNSDGFRINLQSGTTSTTGKAELVLGNAKGSTDDGNKQGQLSIYSTSTAYHRIQGASTSTSKTWTLPAIPGITVNGSASHTNVFAANRYSIIYDDTSHSSTPWYKFAEITITTTYEDHIITFLVSNGYCDSSQTVGEMTGILTAHVRTGSAKTHDSSNSNAAMELKWNLACSNVNPADYVMVYTDTANTSCKVELWCKITKQYDSRIFQVLKEHKRREIGTYWTLIRNDGRARAANYTTGTGTVTSSLCTIKNPTT